MPKSCSWGLAERVTFVHSEFRNSTYANDLLNFSKWMADSMSKNLGYTVYLVSSVSASQDAWRKAALFGRHMNFIGAHYIYPPFRA